MSYNTIHARDVKVGDRIYWPYAYHQDKWVEVTTVTTKGPDVHIDCRGYGSTLKHRDEGVAVRRDEE